jgi:hypothetical protein
VKTGRETDNHDGKQTDKKWENDRQVARRQRNRKRERIMDIYKQEKKDSRLVEEQAEFKQKQGERYRHRQYR